MHRFAQEKATMGLSCNFHQFLTMLIKLTNSSINDPDSNKLQMIMNTDSTATLRFIKKLTVAKDLTNNKLKQQEDPDDSIDFKDLDQLTLKMDMGPMETITHHVQHRFNLAKAEFEQN